MSHSNTKRLLGLALFGLLTLCSGDLLAQQRTWTSTDGTTHFRAELVNAYGSTAYFQKQDDGYIHMPIGLLSTYDIARIMEWANKRDTEPQGVMMSSSGQVTKDICKQWPNRIEGESLKDDEVVNNLIEPRIYTILMVKKETVSLREMVAKLHAAELQVNAYNENFMETLVLTPMKEKDMKAFRFLLAKNGGSWLMPNEWQYKDNKEIWNGYWRLPDVALLVLDPQGHVLCDSSSKEPDGSPSDPIAFINEIAAVAKNMSQGYPSVPNPIINSEKVTELIKQYKAEKKEIASPAPLLMTMSGIEPDMLKQMADKDFQVEMVINSKGLVESLNLKAGGGAMEEEALRRASMLWQFIPVIKDGIAETKTVVAPIRIKGAAEAK